MANNTRGLNDSISLPARAFYTPDLQSRIATALPGNAAGRQARVDAAIASAYSYMDAVVAGITSGGYGFAGGSGTAQDGISFSRASQAFFVSRFGNRGTAQIDQSRTQYDLGGTRLGLLIERGITNFILASQDITDGAWGRNNAGFSTATQLIENTANANHQATQPIAFTNGVTYTFSAAAKPLGTGAKRYLQLQLPATAFGSALTAKFDPANGTTAQVSAGATATSYQEVDGRWICAITATATATATDTVVSRLSATIADNVTAYAGDGASGLDITDYQVEVGPNATTRVITTTATADRAPDVMMIDVSRFGVPEGPKNMLFTFDDNSTQTLSLTVTLGQVAIPTNLNRRVIRRIDTA